MTLDRHTYEAWLLDRLEGRLTPAQEAALDAFLRNHPELCPQEGPLPTVQADVGPLPGKEALRKHFPPIAMPNPANLDEMLVARMENELAPAQLLALDRYLYEHPGSRRQAKLMALAKVTGDGPGFPGKEYLHRHFPPTGMPDAYRLTDFLIAALEGDLSPAQAQALAAYMAAHPGAMREQALVQAARVQAEAMPFPGKEGLKRREGRVIALWARLAVAASVLLVVGAGVWYLRHQADDAVQVVQVAPHVVPPRPAASNVGPLTVRAPKEDAAPEQDAHGKDTGHGPEKTPMVRDGKPEGSRTNPPAEVRPVQETPRPAPPVEDKVPMDPEPALAAARPPDPPMGRPDVPAASAMQPGQPVAALAATVRTGSSQTLGGFMANMLRERVLKEPARDQAIDRDDALALADRALGAVSNGQAGMHVKQVGQGERIKLRIGRHFSISASRERP